MPAADTTPKRTPPRSEAATPMPKDAGARAEAILLSVDKPVPAARIAEVIFHPASVPRKAPADAESEPERDETRSTPAECKAIDDLIASLNLAYEETGRAFRIESVAGGYRILTLPLYADTIARFRSAKGHAKLTRAAIETLAIIAYRQPVTRAELEAIRGVACGDVLKSLMDRRLVTITGRAEELGRPMLYGTTRQFLDHFGFASIKDLPAPEEFKAGA